MLIRLRLLLRGTRRRVADLLDWDLLSEEYHVLVWNYLLLILYTTLETTFVNTLLYMVHDDISIVILYRGIFYITTALMMHPAAYIGQRKTPVLVIRLGAVFYLLCYVLLFAGLGSMGRIMIFTAVLSGSGNAFYWSGHTQLVPHYTEKGNRDLAIALLGIVQGFMTLLVPLISGFVIKWMPGNTGYRVMFGAGMAAAVGQLWVQRGLAPVVQKRHISQAKLAFRMLWKKLSFKLMVGYELLRGFRDGSFAFILNMVLFEIVTDESLVGINTFLTGAASIVGSWVFGRMVRPDRRGQITMLVAAVLTACALPLFGVLSTATIMAFTLISSFLSLFITNSCSNTTYDVMGQNETTRKCLAETAAIRENALGLGRVCGLLVILVLPHDQHGYVSSIIILTASQVLCGILMLLTQRTLNRKKNREVPA